MEDQQSKIEISNAEFQVLKRKAEKFDKIRDRISEFYDQENLDNGLEDVGEWIATYLGFI